MTLNELTARIVGWAQDRNLIEGSTVEKQYLKLGEELGETAEAMQIGDEDGVRDGIGDMYVVLTIMAVQLGSSILRPTPADGIGTGCRCTPGAFGLIGGALARGKTVTGHIWDTVSLLRDDAEGWGFSLEECVAAAWDEIKDRKGRMVDGVFIKEGESN